MILRIGVLAGGWGTRHGAPYRVWVARDVTRAGPPAPRPVPRPACRPRAPCRLPDAAFREAGQAGSGEVQDLVALGGVLVRCHGIGPQHEPHHLPGVRVESEGGGVHPFVGGERPKRLGLPGEETTQNDRTTG